MTDSSGSLRGINREQSVEVIHLDVSRTFPTLGFFQEVIALYTCMCALLHLYAITLCTYIHTYTTLCTYYGLAVMHSAMLTLCVEVRSVHRYQMYAGCEYIYRACAIAHTQGGPYNQVLHDVLGAYACYRPDVGYVQGMSFLAAVLLLNMEASDAFICLANLLNRSSYLAFFRVDHDLMRPYFSTFTSLLQEWLPRVHDHFAKLEFSPEYYLIEWSVEHYSYYGRLCLFDAAAASAVCVCVCVCVCVLCVCVCVCAGYLRCTLAHSHWMWPAECGTCSVEMETAFSLELLLVGPF